MKLLVCPQEGELLRDSRRLEASSAWSPQESVGRLTSRASLPPGPLVFPPGTQAASPRGPVGWGSKGARSCTALGRVCPRPGKVDGGGGNKAGLWEPLLCRETPIHVQEAGGETAIRVQDPGAWSMEAGPGSPLNTCLGCRTDSDFTSDRTIW